MFIHELQHSNSPSDLFFVFITLFPNKLPCILPNKVQALPHHTPSPSAPAADVVASAPLAGDDGLLPAGPYTVKAVLDEAIKVTLDSPEAWDRMSEDACLLRLRALMGPMKRFVQKVRECEGFLSKSQLNEDHGLVPGSHNYTVHMIAEANYKHDISASRISRHASWQFHLEKLRTLVRKRNEDIPKFNPPTKFWPSCLCDKDGERLYQVVAFRVDMSVTLGVVEEIFRGACTKAPKGKSVLTRNMRVTKPVTFELNCNQCARMKISTLQPWGDEANCWMSSCMHVGHLLDPLSEDAGVLCEFQVLNVVQKFPRLVLRLGDDTGMRLMAMKEVSKVPALSTA